MAETRREMGIGSCLENVKSTHKWILEQMPKIRNPVICSLLHTSSIYPYVSFPQNKLKKKKPIV